MADTRAVTREGSLSLGAPLEGLPGVGPVTRDRLAQKGLSTVGDVLFFLPRRYDDLRQVVPIRALIAGQAQMTRGQVVRARIVPAFRRRMMEVLFSDDEGRQLTCRWFHFRGGMLERFPPGARFFVLGTPKPYKGTLQIIHPETIADDGSEAGAGLRVRYPEIDGVPGRVIEKLARHVCDRFAALAPDGLPPEVLRARALPSQAESLVALHAPPHDLDVAAVNALNEGIAPAQQRLIYDEFFFLQLGLARRRGMQRREPGVALDAKRGRAATEKFLAQLPFTPTAAQRRAIEEIARDVSQPHPMHRLLQGDVGSGKTVVAWAACELACASGQQAAVMAPTELLAEQHARTLSPWAKATGRSLALLTASTPRALRETQLGQLQSGKLDVVVGTHALLSERVAFAKLGMVVIDEQHRFGVAQRALLREKGDAVAPHLLVMTATPIPRTLALTVYGDLDVTRLDELPPGREPPDTKILHGKSGRARALTALVAALDDGRQAYWVCPLIGEASGKPAAVEEKVDLADVMETAAWLRDELDVPVGLVHGRLPTAEREQVMRAFRAGELRVLVATTVIEVGVDVPAASLMIVEGAERFGLAQLHQLRGRIGRGGGRSSCLLLAGSRSGDAGDRLAVMAKTSDGFKVAEADLQIRKAGDLFGTRQAGLPRLRFADLVRDFAILERAREDAFALLARDNHLSAHLQTRAVLDARWAEARLFGEEAG